MSTYVLRIQLEEISPLIWREVEVPSELSLGALHEIIQVAMGWQFAHLHEFTVKGKRYGVKDPYDEWGDDIKEQASMTLKKALKKKEDFINYTYDFGDCWEHTIILKDIKPTECKDIKCLQGARKCPPEDIGGSWGYEGFCEIMKDPKHEEYEEMLEWVGEAYDPEHFDPKEVNEVIAQARRRSAE